MEHLWTPWRMAYIKGEKKPVSGCVFCNKVEHTENDITEHVIARSTHTFATLNKFPYTNGHVMIVPYEHISSQEDMTTEALTDLMVMMNRIMRVLREYANPPAFNLGANIGEAAGAGIAAHYHFHIVPRWGGDANFMTTVGDTRVIPDTLDNTYHDLKKIWDDLYKKDSL
jgi:ATP adenylyltransferase